MKPVASILVAALLCLLSVTASGQYHTTSGKALGEYKEGMSSFDYIDYPNAEIHFKAAIRIDSGFWEAYMMLGDLLSKQRRFSEAAQNYKKAVAIDSLSYMPVFFSIATAEMFSGDYQNALVHYQVYMGEKNTSEKNRAIADRNVINCRFAIEAMKKPVPFNPVSVGPGINTSDDEYWPSITADGQTMMFTRQGRSENTVGQRVFSQEDFYISTFSGSVWQKAVNAGPPLNTPQNEGAQSLSSDGKYMYFTACERPGGLGSCDIFFSAVRNGHWTIPADVRSPVNTRFWESQPSVSADGHMLIFSGNRPGGMGGKDLWYSVWNGKNNWGTPRNMGKVINTPNDEMSPFIHFDGRTLYFASDGWPGMGGFDIYISRMQPDSSWSEPVNLGYPINTYNDESGLMIESGGQTAYFSSARDPGMGKDIYSFMLYESVRPDPVAYLKGKVTDKETGQMLTAGYELVNLSTGKPVVNGTTDETGNFLVCLPTGFNYGLSVSRDGYLFYSENFMLEGQHSVKEPYIKRIKLSRLKAGETMVLANIFYETGSWELRSESLSELNKLLELMKANKELKVEIGGYTDSVGSEKSNQELSEKRALSVVNFLIGKGIAPGRLQYKGYGQTSPVGNNVTSEGRQLNRRTEVKVTEYKK
ncbi:MAG: OmpA family protein [Bacteroidales bacterium]